MLKCEKPINSFILFFFFYIVNSLIPICLGLCFCYMGIIPFVQNWDSQIRGAREMIMVSVGY